MRLTIGAILTSGRRQIRPSRPRTTAGNHTATFSHPEEYQPDPFQAIVLKCHCCFNAVEAEEPATGQVFTCDLCHAELEVASTRKGYTRPPNRPSTIHSALILQDARTLPPACEPHTAAIQVGTTVTTNPCAHSATLQRKDALATAASGLFLTPPAAHPAVHLPAPVSPDAETRPAVAPPERELEPTTAVISNGRSLLGRLIDAPRTSTVLLLIALASLILLWLAPPT